jgi:uncharacterized Zn finger protein (UPF0148 family)
MQREMTTEPVVELRCPECKRWLSDAQRYGRVVCPNCGCELSYKSKDARRFERELDRRRLTNAVNAAKVSAKA